MREYNAHIMPSTRSAPTIIAAAKYPPSPVQNRSVAAELLQSGAASYEKSARSRRMYEMEMSQIKRMNEMMLMRILRLERAPRRPRLWVKKPTPSSRICEKNRSNRYSFI
jgi:hypothetical protein